MKHCYILAIACALPASGLFAQVTLTSGSVTPVAGDQYDYVHGDYLPPGPGGTGQTWDLSASALGTSNPISFISPAATGMASTFPNATVAQDLGSGNYLFFRGTATTYEEDGFFTSGITSTCSDRLTVVEYPMSYNTTFTDNQTCTLTQGTSWSRTTDITVTADGYGSLVTANGTISNVLRIHSVRHMVDNQYNPASIYDNDSYSFHKPGVHSAVAVLDHSTANIFGFIVGDSSLSVMDGASIGIEEALLHDIGVEVVPNPACDRVEVLYGVEAGRTLRIDLLDVTGQIVRTTAHRTQVTGVQREVLDIADLPGGVYLVRITDDLGATGMQRLVKH